MYEDLPMQEWMVGPINQFRGKFVLGFQCHNLEHEDMGMMRNYLVR